MAQNADPKTILSVGSDGYVSADDVLVLRRNIFADGVVSREELDALFALGERAPDGDREWLQYFSEAAADFYLREEEPWGYLTQSEFDALKAQVTNDGAKASKLEILLLIELMEKATSTPPDMGGFVGEQLKRHVAEKADGPRVADEDAEMIRRWLFAAGGDGAVAITRAEAERLFDISDAVAGADNAPAWTDLFKKAVANHLMAHIGYQPISRRNAIALHTKDPTDGDPIAPAKLADESALTGVKNRALDVFLNIFAAKAAHRRRVERRYAEINETRTKDAAIAEDVTESEADWLADRIGRDGAITDWERQVIEHMRGLDAQLPPRLRDLVARAA